MDVSEVLPERIGVERGAVFGGAVEARAEQRIGLELDDLLLELCLIGDDGDTGIEDGLARGV